MRSSAQSRLTVPPLAAILLNAMARNARQRGKRKAATQPQPKAERSPDRLIRPQEALTFPAHANDAGRRLDLFLKSKLKWRSRQQVQDLIARREVTVGGARVDRAYRLKEGDVVRLPLVQPADGEIEGIGDIPLDILYEDDVLIVLNKQPNIVVHPVGPHRYNTLLNALHLRFRDFDNEEDDVIPKLAHRVDRQTSGILVAYKTKREDQKAPLVFEHADVVKEYLAIAEGTFESNSGTIDLSLGPEPDAPEYVAKRVVREDGDAARTDYTVRERFERFTLLHMRLHTGRQHQIRVHLQAIGRPVVCDRFYGLREALRVSDVRPLSADEEDALLLDRQALHSWRIAFPHPQTGEPFTAEAPLPDDMRRALHAMRSA